MIAPIPLLLLSLGQTGTATIAEALSTDVRDERAPSLDLGRLLLELPGAFVELAFVPLMPVLLAFERWHLAERLFDLITNEARTLAVLPLIDPLNRSGLGLGLALLHNDPLGSQDRTVLFATVHTNKDVSASAHLARRIAAVSGRVIKLGASYGVDRDTRFFGLGGDSERENVRLIRTESINVSSSIDVLDPGDSDFNARVELAYRRRDLSTGTGADPGLTTEDIFPPPPGFDLALDYPEVTVQLNYDSRDSGSRTTKGFVATLEASGTHDVNGGRTGGVRATATLGGFIPLLPLYRVLLLSGGFSAAIPLDGPDEIPLHHLINLGGTSTLRGYPSDRFIDRLGWWTTAEYRFHVFEYAATGYGLSASLFGDVGKVGHLPADLVKGPIAWSVGIGFRAEANLLLLGRFQVAIGPEGLRVSVGFGELL